MLRHFVFALVHDYIIFNLSFYLDYSILSFSGFSTYLIKVLRLSLINAVENTQSLIILITVF